MYIYEHAMPWIAYYYTLHIQQKNFFFRFLFMQHRTVWYCSVITVFSFFENALSAHLLLFEMKAIVDCMLKFLQK